MTTTTATDTKQIEELFAVGAHYGYKRTRRHPSTAPFVFGVKNTVEIFDLEKTQAKLEEAETFVRDLAKKRGSLLFVSSKPEARTIVRAAAEAVNMPYVAGRWIGGTLTNFDEISKRVGRLKKLISQKEKGEWSQYTKHEQLLLDREVARLEEMFGGLTVMETLPRALFVVDPREEAIAVREAIQLSIPVVALGNTDCNLGEVTHPIPANDANIGSVTFFVERIRDAYAEGTKLQSTTSETPEEKQGEGEKK